MVKGRIKLKQTFEVVCMSYSYLDNNFNYRVTMALTLVRRRELISRKNKKGRNLSETHFKGQDDMDNPLVEIFNTLFKIIWII